HTHDGGGGFHEAVHRRLGRQREAVEGRDRHARQRAEAVPAARHGIHAERSRRDVLSGAGSAYFGAVILIALSASESDGRSAVASGYLLKLRMNTTRSAT